MYIYNVITPVVDAFSPHECLKFCDLPDFGLASGVRGTVWLGALMAATLSRSRFTSWSFEALVLNIRGFIMSWIIRIAIIVYHKWQFIMVYHNYCTISIPYTPMSCP